MSAAAWISLGATIVVGGFFVWLVLETRLLAQNQAPITTYTRLTLMRWPGRSLTLAGILLFTLGALFGHFVWDAQLAL